MVICARNTLSIRFHPHGSRKVNSPEAAFGSDRIQNIQGQVDFPFLLGAFFFFPSLLDLICDIRTGPLWLPRPTPLFQGARSHVAEMFLLIN